MVMVGEIKKYELWGIVTVSLWGGGTGYSYLHIVTDENGVKEIEKNPLQDYLSFGVESVDYACFDVYEKIIKETEKDDEETTIIKERLYKKIEAGKLTIEPPEFPEYITVTYIYSG